MGTNLLEILLLSADLNKCSTHYFTDCCNKIFGPAGTESIDLRSNWDGMILAFYRFVPLLWRISFQFSFSSL